MFFTLLYYNVTRRDTTGQQYGAQCTAQFEDQACAKSQVRKAGQTGQKDAQRLR
jgi:hypothetical protein